MDIKLVIWDLDETLWHGTLADGDHVCVIEYRAEIVRALNQCGIVSSVCSKNDPSSATHLLKELGLWNQFVFPRIAFEPKAPRIRQIIEDMKLRPANVLFVDDNIHNLEEARYLLPELNIANASQPECDRLLAHLLERNKHITKSRLEEYRMLERKLSDRQQQPISPEAFLRSCDIHAVIVHRTDNMEFSDRIEELINRSNQLNYTKSRVEKGSLPDFMADIMHHRYYSVFVWDKYGYHGLVGVAAIDSRSQLEHFVFSCRVMDMGIESWLLHKINAPSLDISNVPVVPRDIDWIHQESFDDFAVRTLIWEKEREKVTADIMLRIMARCQSGAMAHYSGLGGLADPDNNTPGFAFTLTLFLNDDYKQQRFPSMLAYAVLADYANLREEVDGVSSFEKCAVNFCEFVKGHGKKLLVILTPEDFPPERYDPNHNTDEARMAFCNNVWRELAHTYAEVSLLEVTDIAVGDEVINMTNFAPTLLKKIGDHIRYWFDREKAGRAAAPTYPDCA